LRRVLVLGYTHDFFDKRVFLKCVLSLSEVFDEVVYPFWKRERKVSFSIPENVTPVGLPPFHMRTWKRTLFDDPKYKESILNLPGQFDFVVSHDTQGYLAQKRFFRKLKQKFGAKLVFDLHEFLPSASFPSIPDSPVKNWIIEKLWLSRILDEADAFVVVNDFVKQTLGKKGTNRPVFILPNFAHQETFTSLEKKKDRIAIVGGIRNDNGPKEYQKLVEVFLERSHFDFTFIGTPKAALVDFGFPAPLLENPRLHFPGFLPYSAMLEEISMCSFSISHLNFRNINSRFSLPNRFYDSLCAGTPILVPFQLEEQWKIVEREKVGVGFDLTKENWPLELLHKIEEAEYPAIAENLREKMNLFSFEAHKRPLQEFFFSLLSKDGV